MESHSASTLSERFRALTASLSRANTVWHPVLAVVTLIVVGAIATTVYFSSGISNEGVVGHHMAMAVVEPSATMMAAEKDASGPLKLVTRVALGSSVPNVHGPGSNEAQVRFVPGEPLVILEVPVSDDAHGSYRATLSALPRDQERLSEAALQPVMRDSGWVIEFALPVSLVEDGTHYVLTLTGGSGAAGARYPFAVQREQGEQEAGR